MSGETWNPGKPFQDKTGETACYAVVIRSSKGAIIPAQAFGPTKKDAKQRARLIAAVPDLLDAAGAMLKLLGDVDPPDNGELSGAAIKDMLLAAFTKAGGKIETPKTKPNCRTCNGTGKVDGHEDCQICGGGGEPDTCTTCAGEGNVHGAECGICSGRGEVCPDCGGLLGTVSTHGGRVSQDQCRSDGSASGWWGEGCGWVGRLEG